ncbi:MAG: hypothetical protein U0R19_02285 [Bryobacteraceae bacterium]
MDRSAEGNVVSLGESGPGFATMGVYQTQGQFSGFTSRIYYVFDLTSVSGPISSATLRLELDRYFVGAATTNFTIYDFTGNPDDLSLTYSQGSAAGLAIYNDLGSGAVFGSGVADASQFSYACSPTCSGTLGAPGAIASFTLNQAALNAINANLGGKFAIGLRLDDESETNLYTDFKAVTFHYLYSTTPRVAELVLDPVPEPSTCTLITFGFAAALLFRRPR